MPSTTATKGIYEVDEHHHVIISPTIATAMARAQGGVLLNFDSHDDWGIKQLPHPTTTTTTTASECFRNHVIARDPIALKSVEIGTWIMPLVALGAYDTLIWVTKWANIPKESFEAVVGFDGKDRLFVTGEKGGG